MYVVLIAGEYLAVFELVFGNVEELLVREYSVFDYVHFCLIALVVKMSRIALIIA